jgi:hypothetical protein
MPRRPSKEGWQAITFATLRDLQWHRVGELFEAVRAQIPLHFAMRHAVRLCPDREPPSPGRAYWLLFQACLSEIGVESGSPGSQRKWTDKVRLRYVRNRRCEHCGGPVIKSGWTSKLRVTCLACEAAPTEPSPLSEYEQALPGYLAEVQRRIRDIEAMVARGPPKAEGPRLEVLYPRFKEARDQTRSAAAQHRQRGATDLARAELLYKAARPHHGSEGWTADRALATAQARFNGDPLLGVSPRVARRAWAVARQKLSGKAGKQRR